MRTTQIPEKFSQVIFGPKDRNLKYLEESFGIRLSTRGSEVFCEGDEESCRETIRILEEVCDLLEEGYALKDGDFSALAKLLREDRSLSLREFFLGSRIQVTETNFVYPRSLNQKQYLDAIAHTDMVFGIGPAGTGKTYLAVAMALSTFYRRKIKRIVLVRPAVEAGEKLGFLPGDLLEKVNPYLRPLYDALYHLLGTERAGSHLEKDVIEVAPLGFMRGRTLNNAFVILDEAQNTTAEQMKMFLTRIGFHSKAVITGDITQIDLPYAETSGLVQAQSIVSDIEGIGFVYFDEGDVVRHKLVQDIIQAYEEFDRNQA